MNRTVVKTILLIQVILTGYGCQTTLKKEKPNIVYILADDLGYGDVPVYNPQSKIKTPNMDLLASRGMRFTDAHSPSSVCTPTRYGIITGQYCWRSKLPEGVLQGYGRALIDRNQKTVAELMKDQGYHTGIIGKWHLGLDWVVKDQFLDSIDIGSTKTNQFGMVQDMNPNWIDFSKNPTDGPLNHGFNYSFILPASLDMPPYCFLENDSLLNLPNEYTSGNDLNEGYYGEFWRSGRMSENFEFDQVLPTFTEKAEQFIVQKGKSGDPFFLYLAYASPHTPWLATNEFKGSSKAGGYGDFVQMTDAAVGKIIKALDDNDLTKNTIIIFTSDNGPYWREDKIAEYDHRAAYYYRGMKGDIYEGGHRVPFIVSWPDKIEAGSISNVTTSLTNLLKTCADILSVTLGPNDGVDSESILPVLLGDRKSLKEKAPVVHHSASGFFAIRKDNWKLIENRGSGGFTLPVEEVLLPGEAAGQLYNLRVDPGEKNNLFNENLKIVEKLQNTLDSIRRK